VHRSVATRTLGLVSQVGKATPVVMTGGVAHSRAAVKFLSDALRTHVHVPAEPQISGAYGAALLALESLRGATTVVGQAIEREHTHNGSLPSGRDCTTCSIGTGKHQPIDVELWNASAAEGHRT
jgi:predicted NodU family carbamoyl transferase